MSNEHNQYILKTTSQKIINMEALAVLPEKPNATQWEFMIMMIMSHTMKIILKMINGRNQK